MMSMRLKALPQCGAGTARVNSSKRTNLPDAPSIPLIRNGVERMLDSNLPALTGATLHTGPRGDARLAERQFAIL